MKLRFALLLAIAACVMIGNSSFSCTAFKKLAVDSIHNVLPDNYGLTPMIELENLKTDSLQIQFSDGDHLFTKQLFKKKILLVSKGEKKIYTIESFRIISATKDSVTTDFVYHTYNPKHIALSERELTRRGLMLPIAMIDSFTTSAPYKRPVSK